MSSLRASLESLAAAFAIDLVRAIQGASLVEFQQEVATAAKRDRPLGERSTTTRAWLPNRERLDRRSAEDIAAALDRIISLLRGRDGGLRAEQIREMLRMQSKEMPRILSEGLRQAKLRKVGQKRATTYFAK